ncbi:MAG: hypothetical protein ABI783_00860 [Actinomycetota bacterium]
MSNLGLFIVGTLVTLLVTSSMGLLFWGAILDGRDEAAARLEAEQTRQKNIRVFDAT